MDKYIIFYSITIAIVIVIPVINAIISIVLRAVTKFERNKTVSEDYMGNVWKIFVLQFLNIGLVLLLVNMQIDGFKTGIPDFPIFSGDYADFTPAWFAKVGAVILSSMVIGVFTPHLSILIFAILKKFKKWSDSGCSNGRERTKKVIKKNLKAPLLIYFLHTRGISGVKLYET
jgi:hypothetical protein